MENNRTLWLSHIHWPTALVVSAAIVGAALVTATAITHWGQ